MPRRGVDQVLEAARARLVRLDPQQAARAQEEGALLVDTRYEAQRKSDGMIPCAISIERNHLEWRLDPTSQHRIAEVQGYDQQIIVVCNEGYSSSLAAASLQDLGLHRATDVAGGFQAWAAAGLPVERPRAGAQEGPD
jgi:rhodanese-related sulfurtransferase